MALKQATRLLFLKTPLGEDALVLTAFSGREEMSRLFSYQLEMISDNGAISAAQLVGKTVTFGVSLADGTPRYFNGMVSRLYAGDEDRKGRRNYRAEVVPWLWFLTLTAGCRIFQQKSAPEIIEKVFQDLGFSDYEKSQVKGQHPKREYCVQYRETAFDFISRLLEEEGIFYFFKHQDGKHSLVLADQKGVYADCKENEVDFPRDAGDRAMADHISRWEHRYEFRSGKIAQTDYNFEDHPARGEPTPAKLMLTMQSTTVKLDNIQKYEIYDYPGVYEKKNDGDNYAKIRMEEEEAGYDIVDAAGTCRTFAVGGKFKVKHHIAKSEEGKSFAITSIAHTASEPGAYETGPAADSAYDNTFTCIPDSVTFRPARATPRPVIHGAQTAVVVGPAGEEIYPDKYGRVKVQFFWDREGKSDDKSSCWIRVAQGIAGKNWGMVYIPRIGQEVVVSFLEGNPDRPLITGVVYNSDQMPPYQLPDKKTQSGIKTNSSKGGGGSNEMRLDDTKGSEQVFIHAQYNMDTVVENDETITIHGNRTESLYKDESITIGGARTESVSKDESISIGGGRTENVGKSLSITVGDQFVLSVGMASIVLKADGTVLINGNNVSAKASGPLILKGATVLVN